MNATRDAAQDGVVVVVVVVAVAADVVTAEMT
jgi:hypothetical protein